MSDEPDYILDLSVSEGEGAPPDRPAEPAGRNWIGIRFDCCGVYVRIYKNRAGTAYEGACPRCARQVHVAVGAGGTNQRLFRAS